MPGVWAADYRDENRDGTYPFADDATMVADTGLEVPPSLFFDASVYPIGGQAGLRLAAVVVASRSVTFWVGDRVSPRLASGEFDPLLPAETVALADSLGRPAGMLLVDPVGLAAAQTWPLGTHAFAAGVSEFAASCTIPTPESGVRGLRDAAGELLVGDAWLIGERGVVVRTEGDAIRIDVVGDPYFVRRLCEPLERFTAPRFVRTIGGVPPRPDGSFQLIAGNYLALDTILRIVPVPPDTLAIKAVGG